MSSDKSSIIERAQKLAAKGQIDKAIEEWQKLIAETPNDGNIYNTIGDLHLKGSQTKEAITAYMKAADAFRSAGFELKSIAVYKKILKVDPSRIDVYEKLADVHSERGLVANAVEDYLRVAKHYAKQGDLQTSVAVYKKLADLDPKNFAVHQKLAELCQKWGLANEAAEEYGKVLAIYKDQQMTSEAQQVIDEVIKLETSLAPGIAPSAAPPAKEEPAQENAPENVPIEAVAPVEEIKPAEEEPAEPAAEPLAARMERALENGDWSAAESILEELQGDARESFSFLSKWVEHYLGQGLLPKAFLILQKAVLLADAHSFASESRPLIQRYLEEDPEQVSAHRLLGESFEKSGDERGALESYSTVLSLMHKQGSAGAEAYYEAIKSRLPGISEMGPWRELFEAPVEAPVESLVEEEIESAAQESEEAAPVLEEPILSELEPVSDSSADRSASGEAIFSDSIPLETEKNLPPQEEAAPEISDAAFQSQLTEAEVYIKYGLSSKAIEQLKLLSELAPSREEPHLQLKELYIKEGMREQAAEECLFLARFYEKRGAEEKRKSILDELKLIDPNRQYQSEGLEEVKGSGELGDEAALKASDDAEPIEEPVHEAVAEAADIADVQADLGSESVEESAEPQGEGVRARLREAEVYLESGDKNNAKALLWKILEDDSQCAEARMMLLNIQRPQEPAPPVEEPMETSGQEVAAEASFEGLEEELEESLNDLLSEEAETEEVKEAVEAAPVDENQGEYIDLKSIFGEELKDDLEPDDGLDVSLTGLHDVVKDLHAEAQKENDEQEIETHYNLGIAYKEMGLIPEAIKEFELAFQGERRFQDASSMLASCYKENGMIDTAIEILQNALEDSRCKKENILALKYELAGLYDIQGSSNRSKGLYDEIFLLDPNFRDVAVKRTSQRPQPTEPVAPVAQESSKTNRGTNSKKKERISYL